MKGIEYIGKREFIPIDEWVPEEKDLIFKSVKGAIYLNVSEFYGLVDSTILDYFIVSTKRCYNDIKMRDHITHYLNYFIKFYDEDKELLMIFYKMKYLLDFETDTYNYNMFIYDLRRYIMSPSIMTKIERMNNDNYYIDLNNYRNDKNPVLQYTNKHGMILMKISILINMVIPLSCHFIKVKKIFNSNEFLLQVYDMIIHLFSDVDIYNKLYETSISNIMQNKKNNELLWGMQDIRGKNTTTHSLYSVENIILNIIPKYMYSQNIINFNSQSIINNTKFQIVDIGYEYNFVSLSSSNRDMDNNSEFDKFESYLVKADETLFLQNKVNCEDTMKTINMIFGPFNQKEIDFYSKSLSENNKIIINSFQKDMIFNLFYKYFGDPISIKAINKEDYIKLIISAKKMLQGNNMVILPYIVSSKVNRIIQRKNLNKKELQKLESSPYYPKIIDKYKNEKIEKHILSIIATILSSEFQIIDYYDESLNGNIIEAIPDIVCEELLMYITLI